jgi:hypothetical protein
VAEVHCRTDVPVHRSVACKLGQLVWGGVLQTRRAGGGGWGDM